MWKTKLKTYEFVKKNKLRIKICDWLNYKKRKSKNKILVVFFSFSFSIPRKRRRRSKWNFGNGSIECQSNVLFKDRRDLEMQLWKLYILHESRHIWSESWILIRFHFINMDFPMFLDSHVYLLIIQVASYFDFKTCYHEVSKKSEIYGKRISGFIGITRNTCHSL